MTPTTLTNLAVVASIVSSAFAIPAANVVMNNARDVVDPPIISPNTSSVWVVGDTETVVWNTTGLLSYIGNSTGMVVLGYLNGTSPSENLMFPALAQGFPLAAGHVNITVPSVPARDSYIIVLFGDSGNASPKFDIEIQNGTSSTSSSVTSFSATSTSTRQTDAASSTSSSDAVSAATATSSSSSQPGGLILSTSSSSSSAASGSGNTGSSTGTSSSSSSSGSATTSTSAATYFAKTPRALRVLGLSFVAAFASGLALV